MHGKLVVYLVKLTTCKQSCRCRLGAGAIDSTYVSILAHAQQGIIIICSKLHVSISYAAEEKDSTVVQNKLKNLLYDSQLRPRKSSVELKQKK